MDIDTIELNITLPSDRIGMVFMQPFIELSTEQEPFTWPNESKQAQIDRIVRTLEISKEANQGLRKTHFTIFPEYSVPGLEGVEVIGNAVEQSDWDCGTIVLAGIDGLKKEEFTLLCQQNDINDLPERVADQEWVNCLIGLAKDDDGDIVKWIQPKLVPSWPEHATPCNSMFEGKYVHVVKVRFDNQVECIFVGLICFDWIGQIGTRTGINAVLHEINNLWKDSGQKIIHMVFVLEHNPSPNYREFLEATREFFGSPGTFPFVVRENCVILFVNTAGGPSPGKYSSYGYSSMISSPRATWADKACKPTFAVMTKKLRGTDSLGDCKDVLLREFGACIHSFGLNLLPFRSYRTGARTFLISRASVHAIDENCIDARTPDRPVPASVKWVNDTLDSIPLFFSTEDSHPLKEAVGISHDWINQKLRSMDGSRLNKYIEMSSPDTSENENKRLHISGRNIANIDLWDNNEEQSLRTLTHCLSIIGICHSLRFDNTAVHASITLSSEIVDIIIVWGDTHKECYNYAKTSYSGNERRTTLIITGDINHTSVCDRDRSLLESRSNDTETKYTNPKFTRCGFNDIVNALIAKTDQDSLKSELARIMI